MPRTANHIEISHPLSVDPQHIPRLRASASLTKPQRPKSKSLQPCRCSHQGCGKMFSKRSNLKAHMRVHSGVLPYPCHFPGCTKRFRWKSSLKPHIRVHLVSGHVPTPTHSSDSAISSELPTNTNQSLSYTPTAQPQPESASKPVLTGKLLDLHETAPVLEDKDETGGQIPIAITGHDATGMSDETEQRQDRRRMDCESVYPLNKPPVARALFQDSHEQADETEGEIDLSTDSVLSSSAASYETDVVSFSLNSPAEEKHDSTSGKNLTEHLWKSDIQVMDPFEELSMVGGGSHMEVLPGINSGCGISANSMEGHVSESQWMFSCGGSTVSSAEFTTTLNSLSL